MAHDGTEKYWIWPQQPHDESDYGKRGRTAGVTPRPAAALLGPGGEYECHFASVRIKQLKRSYLRRVKKSSFMIFTSCV